MAGYLIYNGFWNKNTPPDPVLRLQRAAADRGENWQPVPNTALCAEYDGGVRVDGFKPGDFALFWDKDVRLGRTLEQCGVRLFNSADAVALCDDKSATHLALAGRFPQPRTLVAPMTYDTFGVEGEDFLRCVAETLGFPCVVKECFGSLGGQVYLAHDAAELKRLATEIAPRPFIAQEYIAESSGEDLRLYVVGDRVAAAMHRHNAGDFRANIAGGGSGDAYAPTEEEAALAVSACRALGLDFGGVDLLRSHRGPLICEVNGSAFLAGITACTGVDVAGCIVDYVLARI